MTKKAIEVAARYRRKYWREVDLDMFEKYHVSAFNFPQCPVVTSDQEIQEFRWGLIPSWVKTPEDAVEIRKMTINAKAETLFEKPSFKHSILSKRCIIPSTGFFEWRHEGNKKIPYFIFLKNEEIFSLAGIYSTWINPLSEETIKTFSIITTEANPMMEFIHNTKKRMPLIFSPENEQRWISEKLNKQEISDLLKPYDQQFMDSYVINDFLKKSLQDPSIIEPKRA